MAVSSTKRHTCETMSSGGTRKRIGPSTEPWGTLDVTGTESDSSPSTTTFCRRLHGKDSIQRKAALLIQLECSFMISFEWFTLSNALGKSRSMRSVRFPRLVLVGARSSMSETVSPKSVSHPKTCSKSYISPFESRCPSFRLCVP